VLAVIFFVFFFFQAEDGIRDRNVTGVQTCALPIWTVPDPSDCGECLPQWDPGNGIRVSAYAGRRCRTCRKRSRSSLGSRAEKLCGSLYGQPGSLDTGRRSAAAHVFLDHEETEQVRELRIRIQRRESRGQDAFWFSLSFYREMR